MHVIKLLSDAITALPDAPAIPSGAVKATCEATGLTTDCLLRKEVVSDNFTNQSRFNALGTGYISTMAYRVLKYKWERAGSWICYPERFVRLKTKADLLEGVLEQDKPEPWAGYITTSYKKHGCLLAPVNANGGNMWLFETMIVNCNNQQKVEEWYNIIQEARNRGVTKQILLSLLPTATQIMRYGLLWWHGFAEWAKKRRSTPLYKLVVYLQPGFDVK